jgi:beta-lactamase regulating signal transducer with metallopeptidase domain
MTEYFIINILIGLWALISIRFLSSSPFRIRFKITIIALLGWLLPLSWLADFIKPIQPLAIAHPLSALSNSIQNVIQPLKESSDIGISWFWVFTLLSLIGLVKYFSDLISLKKIINNHVANSSFYKKEDGVHYFSVKGLNGAHTNGLFHPIVWFDEKFKNTPQLQSLLQHEKQHVEQNDPIWLMLISLVQRLLWWNPLVYILANQSRQLIELSCDEVVSKKLGCNTYEKDLTQIMMDHTQLSANPLMNNILSKSSFNIYRIKQLTKEFNMNKKNKIKLSASTVLLVIFLSALIVSMQSHSHDTQGSYKSIEQQDITENQIVLVMDAHLYTYDNPNDKDNDYSHSSYAVSIIADLGETRIFEADELGGFSINIHPIETKEGAIFMDMKVNFPAELKVLNANPSMMINRTETGSFSMTDDEGKYKFETFITVRK